MHESLTKTTSRKLLGAMLVVAGVTHLTIGRREFPAQVPNAIPKLLPLDKDEVVVFSGVAEIALGSSIALAGPTTKRTICQIAAVFFVAVFPGNISQYVNRRSAFGLDSDSKRFGRLFLQPLLVLWALRSS